MRISTNMMFETGASRLSTLQSALNKTQEMIAANTRILTPADDPIAAARVLEVTQSQTINAQYETNRKFATSSLKLEDSVLGSITNLVQDVQTQIVEAGDATYDDTQRSYIATDLRERLKELVGYANTRDNEGNYLFSGFKTDTQPFSATSTGASYAGDQGQRTLQVGAVRQLAISDSGDAVFCRIPSNALFTSAAATGNTGTATVSALSITDTAQLTAHNYDVVFDVTGGVTTYSVYDTTLDPTMTTPLTPPGSGAAFTSPQTISFEGLEMTITGAPADGDTFTVRQAAADATNTVVIQTGADGVFDMLNDLITLLETPTTTAADKQELTNGLALATANFSEALDNVLTVRASVGARMNEVDALDSAGDDRDLQYSETLSNLRDLDYNKAISELSMQKLSLQAAQQSYVSLMQLSIFNYL